MTTSDASKKAMKKYYNTHRDEYRRRSLEYGRTPVGRARRQLNSCRQRAKKLDVPFDLKLEDIYPFPLKCPILGIPLIPSNHASSPFSPSIDRKIPDLGYTKDNVQVISMRANQLKSNGTIEEFEAILKFLKSER